MSPRGGGDRTPEQREAARRERERRRLERAGEPIPYDLLEPDERAAMAPPPPPEPSFSPEAEQPEPFAEEPAHHEPEPEPEPFAAEQPPAAPDPAPPAADELQETQQWDVNEAWVDEDHAVARSTEPSAPADLAPEPPAPEPTPPPRHPAHPAPPAPRETPAPAQPDADAAATGAHDMPDRDATRAHDVLGSGSGAHDAFDPDATRAHDTLDPAAHDADWTGEHTAAVPPDGDPATGEHEEPLGTRRVSGVHLPHIHRPSRGGKRRGDMPRRGRGVRVKRPGEVAGGGTHRRRSAGPRIVAGVIVLLVLGLLWFVNGIFQPFGGGDGSGSVVVRIPRGASAGDIADLLADRGVISSSFFFGLRAQVAGERANLKSGTYRLRRDMGYGAALDVLTTVEKAPAVPVMNVAIPEGLSRRETAAIARRDGLRGNYVNASRRSAQLDPARYGAPRDATLEGFLFPATYELNRGGKVQSLVDDQLRAFRQNFDAVDLGYARSKRLTPFDVLTIASMVEREVSIPRERPLVAAVIYNRLRDGIPLGIDATLRFEQHDWVNPLKQSVLDNDTPYNTRTKQGLPPGPIGNPGLASIRAAAHPAASRALYYVVKPGVCGEHAFSDTFERFEADVAAYNQARAAAGGKSPQRC